MRTQAACAETGILSHIIAGTAAALAKRSGETEPRQQARAADAAAMIADFQPRNVIEAMLASHSVMFHCLLNDAVEAMHPDDAVETRRAPADIVALSNAFHRNLESFRRFRKAGSEQPGATPGEIVGRADKELADAIADARTGRSAEPAAPPPPAGDVVSPCVGASPPGPPRGETADASAEAQARRFEEPATTHRSAAGIVPPRAVAAPPDLPRAVAAPPDLPRERTAQQRLEAAVDGQRSGPPSIRPSDGSGVNRSGASHAAIKAAAAGGVTAPRVAVGLPK